MAVFYDLLLMVYFFKKSYGNSSFRAPLSNRTPLSDEKNWSQSGAQLEFFARFEYGIL